jgi:hypothetical protein
MSSLVLQLVVLLSVASPSSSSSSSHEALNGHPVRVDAEGRLISWLQPRNQAKSHTPTDLVPAMVWDWLLHHVRVEPNGLPTYYTYPLVYNSSQQPDKHWVHDPGLLVPEFTQAALRWYAYNGSSAARVVVDKAMDLLDYVLANGTSPQQPSWQWPGVTYAESNAGALRYRGAVEDAVTLEDDVKGSAFGVGDGYGVIEPDKIGSMGTALLDGAAWLAGGGTSRAERFRSTAEHFGDVLAARVRPGDAKKSPWPYRVFAESGIVREQYTSNVLWNVRLFDRLLYGARFRQSVHSRMSLVPTSAALKRLHACTQWHSSRAFTPLIG